MVRHKKSSDFFTVSSQPTPGVSLLALSPSTMTFFTRAMHKAASLHPAFFQLHETDTTFLQLVSKSESEIHGNTHIFPKNKTKD